VVFFVDADCAHVFVAALIAPIQIILGIAALYKALLQHFFVAFLANWLCHGFFLSGVVNKLIVWD
jgi:hypothetical protein